MDKIMPRKVFFMIGIIFSITAGIFMSLQGVFNTRLSQKIGLWETNFIVQASGFLLTTIALLIVGSGSFKNARTANKIYYLGGVIGVIIIYSVMKGIESLGPTCSITVILIAQLTSAGIIDAFGLFGSESIKFGITKIIGILIMITGIMIFKWKG
jgi:bacterial/archaeal transporter family-2 protein